jgi:hypothetical protein
LTEFNGILIGISETSKQLFADKFGSQLTSLKFYDLSFEPIIDTFVNIQEIELCNYKTKFYTKTKFKNLKKMSTRFLMERFDLKTFIDNNKNITHLHMSRFFHQKFSPN